MKKDIPVRIVITRYTGEYKMMYNPTRCRKDRCPFSTNTVCAVCGDAYCSIHFDNHRCQRDNPVTFGGIE